MAARYPFRRASRSELDGRTSLVLTKNNFLDTLIINKSTGVPVYAIITQAESTVLYATDTTMTLQRVAAVSWGRSGSSRKTTLIDIGENTRAADEIFPTQKLFNQLLSTREPTRRYTYGAFTCTWIESGYGTYSGGTYTTCYKPRAPSSPPNLNRRDSYQRPSSTPDEPLVSLEGYMIPNKPRYHIHILARDLLRQVPGQDGLTELDHIIIGALLLSSDPPTQRKGRALSEGWMDEAAVQQLLWSGPSRPVPGEIPPLYTVIAEALGEDGFPPPYASRISLVERAQ